ncbi:hypothetical protein HUF15_00735 [Streptomyces samsunensis]|uniref:hypothetical protein n=1 Tax=Streptomyces malaysiensis TaxID=92644 RepID=UPI0015837A83|nr:hypothetical protein [Streptomyces samsunensis]NUH35307.1 hypothetical protein [Streptomyces samsunensis]
MTAWQRLRKALPERGHWDGSRRQYCRTRDDVHRYVIGYRCPLHTPAAMAGRPEPQPGPGMPATAWTTLSPLSASRIADERAIASGKRRSSPHAYRAAQAAVATRKDTTTA